MDTKKPKVKLTGQDGNAFFILGRCTKAGKKAGWGKQEVQKFLDDATSGDYEHLLATCAQYFEVS